MLAESLLALYSYRLKVVKELNMCSSLNLGLNRLRQEWVNICRDNTASHSFFYKTITWIKNSREKKLLALSQQVRTALDNLEKVPVKLLRDSSSEGKETYLKWVNLASEIVNHLGRLPSNKCQRESNNLNRRRISLYYRANLGEKCRAEVTDELFINIQEKARIWRESNPLFTSCKVEQSHQARVERKWQKKLLYACNYQEFAKLLSLDKNLQNEFFKWAIRDNNRVDAFVEFAATCENIQKSLLSSRIGRFGKHLLHFHKTLQKDLSLPFNGTRVSILDDVKEVTVEENWKVSIREIFDDFSLKNQQIGSFEIFYDRGIRNWNAFELGPWNPLEQRFKPIDLSGKWWERLPCLNRISREELQLEHSQLDLSENQWVVAPAATRQSVSMDIDKSHAFLRVYVPIEGGEFYQVYDFGIFAEEFPVTLYEYAIILTKTAPAKYCYPDQNGYFSQRQLSLVPVPIDSKEMGHKIVMTESKRYIQKARDGNLYFQAGGKNCAARFQKMLKKIYRVMGKIMDNFYLVHITEAKPTNPFFKMIMKIVSWIPKFLGLQRLAINTIVFILGSWRKMVVIKPTGPETRSHYDSKFYITNKFHHPAKLPEQIENDKLSGNITYGHAY